MEVDVIIDVVCPWCFVGKRELEKAMALRPSVITKVRYRPYQLDPTTPIAGKDRKAAYKAKFGDSPQVQVMRDALLERGKSLSIAFDFESDVLIANTLNAHRLIRWALSADTGTHDRVVEGLMHRYFEASQHLGDLDILVEVATEAGMDGDLVRELLLSDRDSDLVKSEINQAQQMGITGVPYFIFDNKLAVSGAQDAEILVQAIDKTREFPLDKQPN